MQFDGNLTGEEGLEIFDAAGRLVFKTDVIIQLGVNTISIPDLDITRGFYSVRMKNGTELISEQIIKAN
jgi:hypothetical protein